MSIPVFGALADLKQAYADLIVLSTRAEQLISEALAASEEGEPMPEGWEDAAREWLTEEDTP